MTTRKKTITKKQKKEHIAKMLNTALDLIADEQVRLEADEKPASEYNDIFNEVFEMEIENHKRALQYLEDL
jgi:hypothetical protein